jgi:hypothetical protein
VNAGRLNSGATGNAMAQLVEDEVIDDPNSAGQRAPVDPDFEALAAAWSRGPASAMEEIWGALTWELMGFVRRQPPPV